MCIFKYTVCECVCVSQKTYRQYELLVSSGDETKLGHICEPNIQCTFFKLVLLKYKI